MCLGVPGRVVDVPATHGGQIATVEVQGTKRAVDIGMLDRRPTAGSWVLVHMGFAMDVLEEDEAHQVLSDMDVTALVEPEVPGDPRGR
jgi:hydrogenase maturation protein HypF